MGRAARAEHGFTLAEVVVTVSMMAVLGVTLASTLVSNFGATVAVEAESKGMDELRVALARVEKEFRFAECVYEPFVSTAGGSASGSSLRFKTRVGNGAYEVTYRVTGTTFVRSDGTGDQVVATDVVGSSSLFTAWDATRRRVDVTLTVQPRGSGPRAFETTLTGRNAWREC